MAEKRRCAICGKRRVGQDAPEQATLYHGIRCYMGGVAFICRSCSGNATTSEILGENLTTSIDKTLQGRATTPHAKVLQPKKPVIHAHILKERRGEVFTKIVGVKLGDKVIDSPRGAGTITGVTQAAFPQVDSVTVGWVLLETGYYDPKRLKKRRTRNLLPPRMPMKTYELKKPALDTQGDPTNTVEHMRYITHCGGIAHIIASGLRADRGSEAVSRAISSYISLVGAEVVEVPEKPPETP